MARIRSVKPEFWDSPGTAKASPYARLLFIAMWNWADDWGIGDANPKRLLGFAFPGDDASEVQPRNFRHLAAEVSDCWGVRWYEVDGRAYYEVPSWEKHQRTEKRSTRRNPGSDQAERAVFAEVAENPLLSGGSSEDGTGEQGNRGVTTLSDAPRSDDPDGWAEFWAAYPRKDGKGKALPAYRRALKRASAESILAGAKKYATWARGQERSFIKMPEGWLNADRWADESLDAPQQQAPGSSLWTRGPV